MSHGQHFDVSVGTVLVGQRIERLAGRTVYGVTRKGTFEVAGLTSTEGEA
jgi:hypothetical protein